MPQADYSAALARARQTLATLEEQAAGYTVLTIPASLVNELAEKRKEVARLEALAAGKSSDLPNTLPRRQPFFGREKEIARALSYLAPDDRGWGVLIDGIGGIGKTALAVEVAYLCLEQARFDAFLFVTAKRDRLTAAEEQPVPVEGSASSLDAMLDEIARQLGDQAVTRSSGAEKRTAFLDLMRNYSGPERRVLLIFDNLETLPPDEQTPLFELLRRLPQHCKAILTSRRRAGEGGGWLRLERLDWDTARQIIAERMGRSPRLEGELTRVGEHRWQELYDLTGGSPLALTWALGLMDRRMLSFDRLLDLLRGADPDSPLLRFIYQEARREMGADDWRVLGTLALFAAPASFESLAAVTDLTRQALESALERLSGYALVDAETNDGPYTLHPLTRQLALGELEKRPEEASTLRQRFARHWLDYARRYGGESTEAYKTYDKLEAAWPNLEAAAAQLWRATGLPAGPLRDKEAAQMLDDLADALYNFLFFRGYWDEAFRLAACGYEAARAAGDLQAAGWRACDAAWIHYSRRETDRAAVWADKMATAMEQAGRRRDQAAATQMRGLVAWQRGDPDEAERCYREALAAYRELGDREGEAIVLNSLAGLMHEERKEYDQAESLYRVALEIAKELDLTEPQAYITGNLGQLALDRQRWDEARAYFEQALPLVREVGRLDLVADDLLGLARVLEEEGRYDEALPLAEESLAILEKLRDKDVDESRDLVARLRDKLGGRSRGE